MRTYIGYVIDTVAKLENDPAYLQAANAILVSTWPLVRQYSPDLIGVFLSLEQRSRASGQSGLQKADSIDEMSQAYKARSDQRINNSLESEKPDEAVITLAINRHDFAKARKMIDKLIDGDQKAKLIELVNVNEALGLITKDDIATAQGLAERLNDATSILKVYPMIVSKCVTQKNQQCASDAVLRALKQLKKANSKLPSAPPELPTTSMPDEGAVDPVLLSLSKLAELISSVNEPLAWDVLGEVILSANQSKLDTSQGYIGFRPDIFRILSEKNDARTYQAANELRDRLERIVALANVYQGLSDREKKTSSSSQTSVVSHELTP